MSNYSRTTRKCPVSQLRPELLRAVRDYFRERNLGDPETETLYCCETISTKEKGGILAFLFDDGMENTIHTGMLLTAQKLIWVRSGDQTDVVLTAADLAGIKVNGYTSASAKDIRFEISGYVGDKRDRVRGYVGLGMDADAQEFCEVVKQEIDKVRPPAKSNLPKWLGGG
jgi:hypothetical protein